VVEWSRALDVGLSEWCCSISMVWVQIPSREEQQFAVKISTTSIWTFKIDSKHNLENIIRKMCCYIHVKGNFEN
jgi:hypothetical protein